MTRLTSALELLRELECRQGGRARCMRFSISIGGGGLDAETVRYF